MNFEPVARSAQVPSAKIVRGQFGFFLASSVFFLAPSASLPSFSLPSFSLPFFSLSSVFASFFSGDPQKKGHRWIHGTIGARDGEKSRLSAAKAASRSCGESCDPSGISPEDGTPADPRCWTV